MDENRQRGVIKVYFPFKEYGFITREKGKDLFFLRSAFSQEFHISEGALVDFLIEDTESGKRAIEIRRIG